MYTRAYITAATIAAIVISRIRKGNRSLRLEKGLTLQREEGITKWTRRLRIRGERRGKRTREKERDEGGAGWKRGRREQRGF